MSAVLFQAMTSPGAWVEVGPIGATQAGAYLLTIANGDTAADVVEVALMSAAGTPAAVNLIESGAPIPVNGVLSRWPLALDVGFAIYVKSTSAYCSVTLNGRQGA